MKYTNLNPQLSPEVLEAAGFVFDGYYRVHQVAPIKLLASEVEGEYEVYLEGIPTPPDRRLKVYNYHSLVACMQSVSQFYIDSQVKQAVQADPNLDVLRFMADLLSRYWAADPDIQFAIKVHPQGAIAVTPNNEYTLAIISGDIKKFTIDCYEAGDITTKKSLNIEACPMAMSLSYACQVAREVGGFSLPIIDSVIIYVMDEVIGDLTPRLFFGVGMNKVNHEQSTDTNPESV